MVAIKCAGLGWAELSWAHLGLIRCAGSTWVGLGLAQLGQTGGHDPWASGRARGQVESKYFLNSTVLHFCSRQARRKREFKTKVPVFGAALGAKRLFPSHCQNKCLNLRQGWLLSKEDVRVSCYKKRLTMPIAPDLRKQS